MKNIRLLFKSAVFVLPLSMSAAVCDYKLSFDKSMIDFGDVSSVKKMSVKLTNESIGDNCDLNVFQLYSTKQGQGVFSNSDFSGTIAQNSSIDIEVTMTPNYTDSIIKYEDSDLFVHSVGVDSDGKKHYVKSWVDYRGIELPKQSGEVINGYVLPPEPNKTLNNSTLLGIDSNDNGIRDDLERKIIKSYKIPLKIELEFQSARIVQKILKNPIGNAKILERENAKQGSCSMYLKHQKILKSGDAVKYNIFIEDNAYNTKERVRAFLDFNLALSGGVYGSHELGFTAKACEFDVDTMLKNQRW